MNQLTILAAALAAVFTAFGMAKLLAVPSMRARASHVGFSIDAYRRIGALEVAGAVGLLLGFAVPEVGIAAALGLLLLLAGAVITHLRSGDGLKEVAPAVVLGILVAIVLAVQFPSLR